MRRPRCDGTTLAGERCKFYGIRHAPNGQWLCGVHIDRARRRRLAGYGG